MLEKDVWRYFKNDTEKQFGKLIREETSIDGGFPDVLYQLKTGELGLIELKGGSINEKSIVTFKVAPEQIVFHLMLSPRKSLIWFLLGIDGPIPLAPRSYKKWFFLLRFRDSGDIAGFRTGKVMWNELRTKCLWDGPSFQGDFNNIMKVLAGHVR